ncbi:competence/damage-inducible protein A [Halococcoides cellulosivorans]|uniref:Competence/damage-inducible protein A n=1 Tax=Halococcoides cellulosivorans TaxID=1679096 RepID=A0A2R4X1N1_9EURY|nr:competence/damage-inducible protein A [Halococcoides cellulosivorans]AWB27643.1 competence/damage-inducible protein A [Halococcoides cellulosivorans]
MEVAILTVGEELLAGDTTNTNATWLAEQVTDRGVEVRRILTIPDERDLIADSVRAYHEAFDAVIVTGGIGGTPDDVTMAAVADAFDREMAVSEVSLREVEDRLADIGDSVPELDIDPEAEASIPAGATPLSNPAGLAPGCRIESVSVLPGIPGEMRAMFEEIADDFSGEVASRLLYTVEPEANVTDALAAARDRFDVRVGCYPDRDRRHNRIKLSGVDADALDAASEWLLDTIDASESPVARDWDPGDDPGRS